LHPATCAGGALLLLLAVQCCGPEAGTSTLPFEDVRGRPHEPLETRGHRATVLFFVLPDCPIASFYAPEMGRIVREYSPRGVAFYVVYADPQIDAGTARIHAEDHGYPCPALLDRDLRLARHTGATQTPEAVVLTPSGGLAYRGRIDDLYVDFGKKRFEPSRRDLRDALDAVLAGRPVRDRFTEVVGCFIPEK